MADDAKNKEDAAGEDATPEKPRKKSMGTIGIFGGVMLVEGLALFFAMKWFFGTDADPTMGMMEELTVTTQPFAESKELELAHVRVQNDQGDRTILYSVTVTVRIHHDNEQMVCDFMKNRSATINDVISRIIRSAKPEHLAEPGLETLKRKVGFEMGSLLGDDTVIEQVLIPEFTPLPTGF